MPIQPELIQFEVTTGCNLTCPICPYTATKKDRPPSTVAFDEYREIFQRSFEPPYVIIYSGFSEALLNDDLVQMAAFEKERQCHVFVATNGVLLTEEITARFLDAGVDQFIVSLDTNRPDIYRAIRKGTELPTVVNNIVKLQEEINRRKSRAKIVINSVVMKSTAPHIIPLLDFLHQNGISDVAFIKIMKMAGMNNRFLDEQYLTWDEYETLPFDEINAHARKLSIQTMRSDQTVLEHRGCHLPEKSFYISAEFDVTVCPYLNFVEGYTFGNLRKDSIDEIRDSQQFRDFRELFRNGRFVEVCPACACLFS